VFTARYTLSPYIKQIRFVFKGLNQFCLVFYRTVSESVLSQREPWWLKKYNWVSFFSTNRASRLDSSVCNFRQLTRGVSNTGPGGLGLEHISTRDRQIRGRAASAVDSARRRRCRSPCFHSRPDPGKRPLSCRRWRSGPAAVQVVAAKPPQSRHRRLWVMWQARLSGACRSSSGPVARLSAG
jgi:hypothetical protein